MSDDTKGSSAKDRFAVVRTFVVVGVWVVIAGLVAHFRKGWAPIAQPSFQNVSSKAWSVVLFCGAVAALTMGFVQIFRMILPLRGLFHRQALEKWLGTADEEPVDAAAAQNPTREAAGDTPQGDAGTPKEADSAWQRVLKEFGMTKPSVGLAITEFEERRGAGNSRKKTSSAWSFAPSMNLYDLPIEQLCGQLNLAFEAALDDPKLYKNFILLTVGEEGAENLLAIVQPPPVPPGARDGAKADKFEAAMLARGESRGSISRTSHLRIDMFQISAGGEWRFWLRSAVLVVSIGLSFAILFTATGEFEIHGFVDTLKSASGVLVNVVISFGYALIFGSISAYLAMFLRDLAAIVENKKRRMT